MGKPSAIPSVHTGKSKRKTPVVGFADGKLDPREMAARANAARWGKDRRTLVQMAQQARPEAFETIVALMRKADRDSVRKDAAALVLAYSDGLPRATLDVSVGPREMSSLTRTELEAIARGAPPPFQLVHEGNVIEGEAVALKHAAPDLIGATGSEPAARTAARRSNRAEKST